jgi:DNA-binding NarL/FixJ family response regulator
VPGSSRAIVDELLLLAAATVWKTITSSPHPGSPTGAHAAKAPRLPETAEAREREVLALLAQDYRAGATAEHLVVSLTTVRTQIRAILVKLEVNSQLEAVALANRAGWW